VPPDHTEASTTLSPSTPVERKSLPGGRASCDPALEVRPSIAPGSGDKGGRKEKKKERKKAGEHHVHVVVVGDYLVPDPRLAEGGKEGRKQVMAPNDMALFSNRVVRPLRRREKEKK